MSRPNLEPVAARALLEWQIAMGADEARSRGSLRFSLAHTSTQDDVDTLGAAIGEAVQRARRAAR